MEEGGGCREPSPNPGLGSVCVSAENAESQNKDPPRKIRGNDLCSQEAVRDKRSSADLESSRGFKALGVMMGNDEP